MLILMAKHGLGLFLERLTNRIGYREEECPKSTLTAHMILKGGLLVFGDGEGLLGL